MAKLIELITGKKDIDQIQRNINWVDNQIKNLEQTKFILEQQIKRMNDEKQKLIQKMNAK